jgi:endoglucanase
MKLRTIITTILIAIALSGIGFGFYTLYQNKVQQTNDAPQVFANSRMLLELWSRYKQYTLEPESMRTLDRTQSDITTSEGQSYTMMRAVWMDDQETFQKSWQWTKDNLQRDDSLMAWKFGEIENGRYGILESIGGQNTATDADVDIAFALLMAAGRWKEPSYKWDALPIISAIWNEEVVTINGKPILTANNLEKNNTASVIVNPSYFSPYAYRVFAKADPTHNWNAVVDSSYELLFASTDSTLNKQTSSGLVPDWIRVDRTTSAVTVDPALSTNYGFEALRTPWRLALDHKWYGEPRAKQVLSKFSLLHDEYVNNGKIFAAYTHDGKPAVDYESPALYGGSQAYFDVVHPEIADEYFTRQLTTYYSPDTQSWKNQLAYYDDNWVWFGMAYHTDQLPNLTELINE